MPRSVELTAAHCPGAHSAGVSLLSRRRQVSTPASTHEGAALAGRWQYEGGEGSCLDAIREEEVVLVEDVAADGAQRHPRWASRVAEGTGLRSSLSCRLSTEREQPGSVDVDATRPGAFDAEDREQAQGLAGQLASRSRPRASWRGCGWGWRAGR